MDGPMASSIWKMTQTKIRCESSMSSNVTCTGSWQGLSIHSIHTYIRSYIRTLYIQYL
ncbi:hypothetical protein M3J09_005348 [Ascochyta lentis]